LAWLSCHPSGLCTLLEFKANGCLKCKAIFIKLFLGSPGFSWILGGTSPGFYGLEPIGSWLLGLRRQHVSLGQKEEQIERRP
jgi:hypothetical protein